MPTKNFITTSSPDKKLMIRHIKRLFGTEGFTYQSYAKKGPQHLNKTETVKLSDRIIDQLCELNLEGANIAVVPNVMDGRGRKAENCEAINWVFVDCDKGHNTVKSLIALPVVPNLIVQTSPGHLHPYWQIEGCKVEEFKALQGALAVKLKEVDAVSDPSRCMRLAGTLNQKSRKPDVAIIVHPLEGRIRRKVHKLADFVQQMELSLVADKSRNGKSVENGDSGDLNEKQVRAYLRRIHADERSTWLKVGKALHSRWPDDKGFAMWEQWSRISANFDADDQRETWNAFAPKKGITLGTLVHLAGGVQEIPSHTEYEFGQAIAKAAKGRLGYDANTRQWWRFTGVRWERNKADHQALKFVQSYLDDLVAETEDENQVSHLRPVPRMSAAIRQAQLDDDLAIDESKFDSNPVLLGVMNGVVDLSTGEFRFGRPGDLLSMQAKVEYKAEAKCPQFVAFVKAVCQNRKSLCMYLLRALGYSLTGHAKEQILFMPVGNTGNGKGTLMNTVAEILGEYAQPVSPMLLMRAYAGNPNAPSPALMKLRGARMIVCTETEQGKGLDEAFIKQLTGGDKLVGREGYGEQTEFTVQGKLWVSTNHDPEIAYGAEAMWRRIRVLPFDAQFTGESEDKNLMSKLRDEAPGILNLLIKHAKLYIDDGMPLCTQVDEATVKLRERLDSVKQWLDARTHAIDDERLQSQKAHKSYVQFCRSVHRPPLGQPAFKAAMLSHGFSLVRRSEYNCFKGIRLVRD